MNLRERRIRKIIRNLLSETEHQDWDTGKGSPFSTGEIPEPPGGVPKKAWSEAVKSLYWHVGKGLVDSSSPSGKYLKHPETITLVDYTLKARVPRLWVIEWDLNQDPPENPKIVFGPMHVGHGRGSDPTETSSGRALIFTNVEGTNATALGAFATAAPAEYDDGTYEKDDRDTCYQSKAGQRRDPQTGEKGTDTFLKIHGLDSGNSPDNELYGSNLATYGRAIGIHSAAYVSDKWAGRSYGCLAVDHSQLETLIDLTRGGTFIYSYGGKSAKNIQQRSVYEKEKSRILQLKESSGKVVNLFGDKEPKADPDVDIDSFLDQRKRQSGDLEGAIETLMDLSNVIRDNGSKLIDRTNKREAPMRVSIAARMIDSIGFSLFERRDVVDIYEIIQALSVLSESFAEEFISTYVKEIGIMSDDSIFAKDFNGSPAYLSITNKIKELLN